MFQSTRPHGARRYCKAIAVRIAGFQSTRPHGARPFIYGDDSSQRCFNPRARTGRDDNKVARLTTLPVSIHAPARGATGGFYNLMQAAVFQSTRPHGARRLLKFFSTCEFVFQSTRPHGARPREDSRLLQPMQFQSTRPHGARRRRCVWTGFYSWSFNPRARTGRDADKILQTPKIKSFNPRARTGRDISNRPVKSILDGFNPRARTGRDSIFCNSSA